MKQSLLNIVIKSRLLSLLFHIIGRLIPSTNKTKRFKNVLLAMYCINREFTNAANLPVHVRIAPVSICNYKCLFCEIHKDNVLYPNRSSNTLTMDDLRNFEHMLSTAYDLSFYGGSEEPLINRKFGDFVKYLKTKYGMRMMINTNASLLSQNLSDIFINYGFDHVLVSYHAGTKDKYKYLMTGDIDKVNKNLSYLHDEKKKRGKKKPKVDFNFALHRLNALEYNKIFKAAKSYGIDSVLISRYYGGRNKLQEQNVSFEYDIEKGNEVLDDLYRKAGEKGVRLSPEKPKYWTNIVESVQWDDNDFDRNRLCAEPWLTLHFNPVLDAENSHYVGVCNRIELFKINYRQAGLDKKNFQKLWNHPVLRHLRDTVNDPDRINPICKFCKNRSTATLRNVDEERYAGIRDNAVKSFFNEFRAKYDFDLLESVEVLEENPNADTKFSDAVSGKVAADKS